MPPLFARPGHIGTVTARRARYAAICPLVALAILGGLTGGMAQTKSDRNKRIESMQQEAAKLIDIPDAFYGRLDDDAISVLSMRLADFVSQRIPRPVDASQAKTSPPLLVASSPRVVAPLAVNTWPLLVGRYTTGWRSWAVHWRENGRVIVADLESGRVLTHLLQEREKADKREALSTASMSGPAPGDFAAATTSTGVTRYRPFKDLVGAATPLPARFALTVIAFDCKSNTVISTVSAPEGEPPAKTAPQKRVPTEGLHLLPPTPESFTAPAAAQPGQALPIEIALDLTVEQGAVIASGADGASGANGLLAVTILLVKRDAGLPISVDLWAPARLQGATGPGQRASTAFSADLNQLHDTSELRGLFQLYVVAGGRTLGPRPVVFGDLSGPEALFGR